MGPPQPRVMAHWTSNGRIVANVAQGVRRGPVGRPEVVYFAMVIGLPPDPCPRFTCAVTKVEEALARMHVVAVRTMAT